MPTTKKATAAPAETADKYAPTAWTTEYLEDVRVPSGQLVQVRRPGLNGLVREGILDDLDTLTGIVDDKHIKRVKEPADRKKKAKPSDDMDIVSMAKDGEQIKKVMETMDRVTCYIVVQPEVRPAIIVDEETGEERPILDSERDSGVVYVDTVEIEDKVFLMNYAVGGTRDLERFRQELDGVVGSVEDESAVGSASE